MDDYTTRHIRGMNVSCNAVLNSDLTKGFDVLLYKIELIRPNGSSFVLEDFSGSAWPGTALSDDVPTGGTGKSLLIHCAPNTTTTVARPAPPFDLTLDVVEDYTQVRYHWKTPDSFKE